MFFWERRERVVEAAELERVVHRDLERVEQAEMDLERVEQAEMGLEKEMEGLDLEELVELGQNVQVARS